MRRGALLAALLLAGCGGSPHKPVATRTSAVEEQAQVSQVPVAMPTAHRARPAPVALVTAETENRLLVVSLGSGRVLRRIGLPTDPENVISAGPLALVVSPVARAVTVLHRSSPGQRTTIGGFESPHIPALFPGDDYAYVTDDAAGTLTVIRLSDGRAVDRIEVGPGAHHLTTSPDGHRTWVALGESASTIVILDTSDSARPRVIGRFDPSFVVHDVSFSPDGRQVWVTAAHGDDVTVFRPDDHLALFRVPVGPGPQHVAFAGHYAYLTSGYGSAIEQVDAHTGRVLARAATPYGSFELDAADGYVATSSLLRGTLAVFTSGLRLLWTAQLAPATRDLAISAG
jgi:DNA-binding beta-propeller fold protein YncE